MLLQTGLADRELFEYVFGGDNTLLASSFVLNIALAGVTILAIVYLGRNLTDPRAKLITIALLLISVVSISSYSALTAGLTLSVIEMPPGHPAAGVTTAGEPGVLTMWGRYLTWTFSTPFILIALGLIAGSNYTKILTACAFTVGMCVTGLAAALTTSSLVLRWWWFALGTVFFLVIVYIILVDWTAEANAIGTGDLYRTRNSSPLSDGSVPIFWALGVEGFALLDVAITSWGYSILDIITKYVVTFIAMLYVAREPDAVTGGPEFGSSLPVIDRKRP
ncbi:MAG: bacteriorhodopsin [Natrialbaceae archaeon]|nr:bacteriorhodopsin [Natrialbaceae archaeon]